MCLRFAARHNRPNRAANGKRTTHHREHDPPGVEGAALVIECDPIGIGCAVGPRLVASRPSPRKQADACERERSTARQEADRAGGGTFRALLGSGGLGGALATFGAGSGAVATAGGVSAGLAGGLGWACSTE